MRLKQIKLAGFKSFVDATTIPFKHTMTAIVGPNGCGKSNIIDAVRWVLGESSAKNLRGDAMSDVIFNGAASRKPISQASVELIFENAAQQLTDKIKGSSANRNEIAIRRVVNREGSNSYFLNGTKCRRRDITDIFLGTGLGPRSYAIIEQGTISRLIESKPQELRIFIEEAAGISKYKERRKETENSIRHTRENLARLGDIRAELLIQIDKLHQQAEAAKRFTNLKQQERKHKAELAAMRWQQFDEKSQQHQKELSQAEQEVASLNLLQKQHQFEIENIKQQNNVDDYQLKDLHLKKVQLTEKIAKIEQSIKFTKQQQQQFEQSLLDIDKKLVNAEQVLIKDSQSQQQTKHSYQKSEPKLAALNHSISSKQLQLNEALKKQQELQQCWQQLNSEQTKQLTLHNTINSNINRQKSLIHRSEQQLNTFELQIKELTAQQEQINDQVFNEVQLNKEIQRLAELEKQLKITHEYIAQQQSLFSEKQQQLAKSQGIEQSLNQQINQLISQLAGGSDWSQQQQLWLEQQNLIAAKTLHQIIAIDEKWQFAVEQVLSYWLQAVIIDNLNEKATSKLADKLVELSVIEHALLITTSDNTGELNSPLINKGSLAELLIDSGVFLPQWNDIFLANDLIEAKKLLSGLARHQSVLCPDSSWVGHDFIRKGHVESSAQLHLLEKESELSKLKQQLLGCEQSEKIINDEQKIIQTNIEQQQYVLQKQQTELNCFQQEIQQLQQKNALIQQQQLHLSQQQKKLKHAHHQTKKLLENEQALLASYFSEQQQLKPIENDQVQQEAIAMQRDVLQKDIDLLQAQIQKMQDERHQLAVKVEQEKAEQKHLKTNVERHQEQLDLLQEQQQKIKKALGNAKTSSIAEQEQLNDWLTKMLVLDESLQEVHLKQSEIEQRLASIEQAKQNTNEKLDNAKQQLSKSQIALENNKVRAQANLEQIAELQQNLTQILAELPKHAQETHWQAKLIKLAKDINQLGAINLAAISEYEQQLQRKNYLDLQNDDLTDALTTLESAIATIDKESKQKFKATFEQVNRDLQTLFPKVFGGGSAYLTLTGDDLLEAGVTIMARPPGKKNSTIHLLSGGEKALTALSLVFAIFRLNPAPFCLLDEVDAPLDDANVARFCNLVQEMSQTVQFIYISHNKIAMEMASHLTGVTMFEPGVSKMVAVDIDEAVAMAELA